MFYFVLIALFWLVAFRLDESESNLQIRDRSEAILGVLFIPAGGYLAWLSFTYSHREQVARVLRSYIFGAFMFAGLYFGVYIRHPASFSFSSGILSRVELQRFSALSEDINRYYRQSIAASKFFEWISTMSASDFDKFRAERIGAIWPLGDGIKVKFDSRVIGGEFAVVEYDVEFVDSEGPLYAWQDKAGRDWSPLNWVSSPQYRLVAAENISRDEYLRAILELKKEFEVDAKGLLREMSTAEKRAFNLLDFVYFSFVTVTTLGYGDVVPNETWVRILIVGQILFGFFLVLAASRKDLLTNEGG